MKTVHIYNRPDKLTANFLMSEFYTSTNPQQEWDCPQPLIDAAQIMRDHFGVAVIVSSTYRHPDKYGRGSAHDFGLAIDMFSRKIDIISLYNTEITNYLAGKPSTLITKLRKAGIDGFGIEGGCIHLDCGGYGVSRGRKKHTDEYGEWSAFIWNPSKNINRSL